MNAFQKNLHSKTVKILAAVFIIGAVGGPTAIKSADPKTRSHFTAKSTRPSPLSESPEAAEKSKYADERDSAVDELEEEASELSTDEAKKDRELERQAARQESESRRLERQQRRLQEKLQAQIRDEKRRQEKELARQLAQEAAEAKAAMLRRLEIQEAEAQQALLAKMEEEKRAKEVELEKRMEEKAQVAQEAMADRITEEENQGILSIDRELEKLETSLRDDLQSRIAKEERRRETEVQKRISREEKAAKKEMEKRLAERERLAEAELLARLELEQTDQLEGVENRVSELADTQRAEMNEGLMEVEVEGLRKIEDDLLESARRELEKRSVEKNADMAQVADSPSKGHLETKVPFRNSIKYVLYSENEYEINSKRPTILRTLKRAPRNLMASLGNLPLRRSDPYPGYLAYATPPPLRFSDSDALAKRASSPALPEFSLLAPGRGTEVFESRLSVETARRNQIRNQVVVEFDPYTVVSGRIDTSIPRRGKDRELIMGDEFEEPVVRPEEVLIFFENEREGGDVRTIVPFSPALPQEREPSRSGATYNRIE